MMKNTLDDFVPFSRRTQITEKVMKWLESENAQPNVFNVVTALHALGYLRKAPEKPQNPRMISGEKPA